MPIIKDSKNENNAKKDKSPKKDVNIIERMKADIVNKIMVPIN